VLVARTKFLNIVHVNLNLRSVKLLINPIIFSLTPWSGVLLDKLTGSQLAKDFPAL
jgi:hypothetical protein